MSIPTTRSLRSLALALCAVAPLPAAAQPLAADSLFGDWTGIPQAASDPFGDATQQFDITSVHVTSRGTDLFIRFDTDVTRNLIAGSASDGQFRVDITYDAKLLRLDYRSRSVTWDGGSLSWVDIGAKLHSTYASNEFELRVDMSSVGASVGDSVSINFSGSDSLASDIPHTMSTPAVPETRRDPSIHPDADFRIVSLNTLQTGILDGSQASR
ncbi:MAG: hypothetical protein ACYTF7_09530, partial [Planctomycetota bacterium]